MEFSVLEYCLNYNGTSNEFIKIKVTYTLNFFERMLNKVIKEECFDLIGSGKNWRFLGNWEKPPKRMIEFVQNYVKGYNNVSLQREV